MGNWALLLELSEKAPKKKVPKLLSPPLKTCLSHETKILKGIGEWLYVILLNYLPR